MPSPVLTPAQPAEPSEPTFLVGFLTGLTLAAVLAYPLCLLLLKL